MSTEIAAAATKPEAQVLALQAKSRLAMPITRIKTDAKRLSGCDQMATNAAVFMAAVVERFAEDVARNSDQRRKKGHSSVAPDVVVEYVASNPDFAAVLGATPVFVTGAKKVARRSKDAGSDVSGSPVAEDKTEASLKRARAESEEDSADSEDEVEAPAPATKKKKKTAESDAPKKKKKKLVVVEAAPKATKAAAKKTGPAKTKPAKQAASEDDSEDDTTDSE